MRIVMIGTRGVPAHYGGFETAVEEIGSRLAAAGQDVTVYCRRGNNGSSDDPATYSGMRLVHLPCVHKKALETLSHTALSALHLALSRHRHDVALVFNSANVFAVPLLHLLGLPVAVHVDGLEWRRAKWGPMGQRFYRWSEARAVRDADALIADASGIQDYYREEFGASARLLEYGTRITADGPHERLGEIGLEPLGYHLLVARVEPENHVLEMIRAYAVSGALLPLLVVGDAPYRSEYRDAVYREAAGSAGVRMIGGVWDQELLDQLYIGAASYLHGHSVGGTNPSLLRAMGAGATTIAHDNVFNRGVLGEDGIFGTSTGELARAIADVDSDPSAFATRRRRLVQRCRERYVWDAVARDYAQLCADLVAGSSQRHQNTGRRNPRSAWRRPADESSAGPVVDP